MINVQGGMMRKYTDKEEKKRVYSLIRIETKPKTIERKSESVKDTYTVTKR